MYSELWGPGMWHILFAAAWNGPETTDSPLTKLRRLLALAGELLPCPSCRLNHVAHHAALTRRHGRPNSCGKVFEYLFYLKDEVNRTIAGERHRRKLSCRSPPLERILERYSLRGDVVDESLVVDTLLMVAVDADQRDKQAEFREFCQLAAQLLPENRGSPLRACLQATAQGSVVVAARRSYSLVRKFHDLPVLRLTDFRRQLRLDES